jgi:hypothetical protein
MGELLWKLLGLTVCLVAIALIILEGGALEETLVVPRTSERVEATAPKEPRGLRAIRFFFGGGGAEHRIAGTLHGVALEQVIALGIPPGSLVATEDGFRFAFPSPAADLIGFAVVTPPRALHWEWSLDGSPWPADAVFAGPYGLRASDLLNGIGVSCAEGFASGAGTPFFSAHQVGAFVICEDR